MKIELLLCAKTRMNLKKYVRLKSNNKNIYYGITFIWKPRKYVMPANLGLPGALVGGNWKEAMEIFRMMIMFCILIMMSVTQIYRFVSIRWMQL